MIAELYQSQLDEYCIRPRFPVTLTGVVAYWLGQLLFSAGLWEGGFRTARKQDEKEGKARVSRPV